MYAEYTAVRHTVNYANSLRCGQGIFLYRLFYFQSFRQFEAKNLNIYTCLVVVNCKWNEVIKCEFYYSWAILVSLAPILGFHSYDKTAMLVYRTEKFPSSFA